jgi:hypothetical protein
MLKRLAGVLCAVVILLGCVAVLAQPVSAGPSTSTNYRFNESTVGAGGLIQSSSANYQGRDSIGDVSIGNAASSSYQINAGSTTTNDPSLSFSIASGAINFGDFTAANATTTTASFTVLNYTTYGYIVQIIGGAPHNGATTLTAMPTTDVSIPGTSQFGINLVANTSPVSVGANPNNGQFGFGVANPNYAVPNQYRYVEGETIAQATRDSGLTTYTISYLVNVEALTPGGKFTSDQTLIVTGTY